MCILAVALILTLGLTGCGGSPGTVTSDAHSSTVSGAQVFSSAGCAGCHTLAAAHSTDTIGPDLDSLKPSYTAVLHQVEHGGGQMPSFASSLSAAQIRAVAHYVAAATH